MTLRLIPKDRIKEQSRKIKTDIDNFLFSKTVSNAGGCGANHIDEKALQHLAGSSGGETLERN
jgi:hypothetical protein